MVIKCARNRSGSLSRKQQNSVIGEHSQDRLYRDRRFRQKFLQECGPAVCKGCSAISYEKHWFIDPPRAKALGEDSKVRHVFCPGCHKVAEEIYDGEVILESPILAETKDAVMGLIKHTELKCWHDNPMSRIGKIVDLGDRLEISTTTTWLGMRIGKEMRKAYKGSLDIKSSPREKFVRVRWSH